MLLPLVWSNKSEGVIDIHDGLEIAENTLERAKISGLVLKVLDEMT